jgi:hypothetical protein
MTRTCKGCKACPVENNYKYCELGFKIISKKRENIFDRRLMDDYIPDETCTKPKTNREFIFLMNLNRQRSGLK